MFLETTPEGKIYKELAADHFADPKGLGKYALFLRPSQGDLIPAPQMEPSLLLSGRYRPITLEGRNLFATRDFYPQGGGGDRHEQAAGGHAGDPRGTGQCPPHRRRQESLSDQKQEYEHRIKNNKARSPRGAGLVCLTGIPIRRAETEPVS